MKDKKPKKKTTHPWRIYDPMAFSRKKTQPTTLPNSNMRVIKL
jgi:hypothetical protein